MGICKSKDKDSKQVVEPVNPNSVTKKNPEQQQDLPKEKTQQNPKQNQVLCLDSNNSNNNSNNNKPAIPLAQRFDESPLCKNNDQNKEIEGLRETQPKDKKTIAWDDKKEDDEKEYEGFLELNIKPDHSRHSGQISRTYVSHECLSPDKNEFSRSAKKKLTTQEIENKNSSEQKSRRSNRKKFSEAYSREKSRKPTLQELDIKEDKEDEDDEDMPVMRDISIDKDEKMVNISKNQEEKEEDFNKIKMVPLHKTLLVGKVFISEIL